MLRKLNNDGNSFVDNDTKLGNWYINYIYMRPYHVAIFVSELSYLPIFVPATPINALFDRFQIQLEKILNYYPISQKEITGEIEKLNIKAISKTRNKSLLGTMNEFTYHLQFIKITQDPKALINANIEIANIPISPIKYAYPSEKAIELMKDEATQHAH